MEKTTFNRHGQWSLKKSDAQDWVTGEDSALRDKIPRMEGEHRQKALGDLKNMTPSRKAKDGKLEFLLHRGINAGGEKYEPHHKSSWTTTPKVAHRQAYYEDTPGKVRSAWVHEDNLVSSMRHQEYKDKQARKVADEENEWIVSHHTPIDIHDEVDARNPRTIGK